MKRRELYWIGRWSAKARDEGPITPEDAAELLSAFIWDGDYRRAHEIADALTHFYIHDKSHNREMLFGQFLGMRTVIAVLVSKADAKRSHAREHRARAYVRIALASASNARARR